MKQTMYGKKLPFSKHDGSTINFSDTGEVNIIFEKIVGEDDKAVYVDMVAAIQFPTIEQLKEFRDHLNGAIEAQEN